MTEGDVGRGAQEVRRGRLRPALLVQPVPGWMWGSCRVAPRPVIVRTVIAELLIHELLVVAWTLPCSRPAIYDRRRWQPLRLLHGSL